MAQLPPSFASAVDLSTLKTPAATSAAAERSPYVVDVTEADFESLMQVSARVPVVLDFWAGWCGPCKQLSPILEALAAQSQGRWVLAKVDVDANPQISAAFQIQSIPSVFGLISGQPVPMFQGALPEVQVKVYIEKLLELAAQNGINGQLGDAQASQREAAADEEVLDPEEERALTALDSGDLDGAIAAYRALLVRVPDHQYAATSLAQVELLKRVQGLDAQQVRAAAAGSPADVAAQIACADLDMSGGHVEDAFARLIDAVRNTGGDERAKAREHLLVLFALLDPTDQRVIKARTQLANALF